MRFRLLAALGLPALIFAGACGSASIDEPTGTGGTTGTAGTSASGSAGSTGTAGTSGQAGTSGGAGTTGSGAGNAGTTGSGGIGTGEAGSAGGASGSAGRGGTNGTAGVTGSGGGTAGVTGTAGRGGTTGTAGAAGGASGSAGRGGTTGTAGTTGSAGSTGSGGSGTPGPSGLPVPPGASGMPKPTGAGTTLTVVNWAGFKGAVTYSFDDDNDSQISNYSMLKAAGGEYTFFLWTGRSQATNAIWKTAMADGHEIGNHTKSHDSNGQCNATDVKAGGDFIMSTFGKPAQTFAAPNGSTCFKTPASMYYFINRGVSPASPVTPTSNADPLNLNCYIPAQGQQASTFNSNVDSGRSQGGWVIYVVHGFSSSDGSYQPVDIGQMTTAIKYAKSLGDMWVGSMVNVGAYWQGQKAFAAAMTSTSGSDKTWTWTLPAHFPPGHYLRIKSDGGTVKQKGVEVPWDSHGYYEIALDAGSVTLSP